MMTFKSDKIEQRLKFYNKEQIRGLVAACTLVFGKNRDKNVSLKNEEGEEINWSDYEEREQKITFVDNHDNLYNRTQSNETTENSVSSDADTEITEFDSEDDRDLYSFDLTLNGTEGYHYSVEGIFFFTGLHLGLEFFGKTMEKCIVNLKHNDRPYDMMYLIKDLFDL